MRTRFRLYRQIAGFGLLSAIWFAAKLDALFSHAADDDGRIVC